MADAKGSDLSLIDGSTGRLMATGVAQLPGRPEGVALSPDGGALLVTVTDNGCGGSGGAAARAGRGARSCPHPLVAVVSTSTWDVTMYLATASDPGAVGVDPSTGNAVMAGGKGALAVIPLSSRRRRPRQSAQRHRRGRHRSHRVVGTERDNLGCTR